MKYYYKRHLPHIQPLGGIIFVTFRLANSLPKKVIDQLKYDYKSLVRLSENNKQHKRIYDRKIHELINRYDKYLHKTSKGPFYLRKTEMADLVCDTMKYHNGKTYDLISYCVMPNHVHILLQPYEISIEEYVPISKIMHNIKSYTANRINKILGRKGQFWEHESFDRYSRSDNDTVKIIKYILDNPVEAGLVSKRENWIWSYVKQEYGQYF